MTVTSSSRSMTAAAKDLGVSMTKLTKLVNDHDIPVAMIHARCGVLDTKQFNKLVDILSKAERAQLARSQKLIARYERLKNG